MVRVKGKFIERNCLNCSEVFSFRPYRIKTAHYCSYKCKFAHYRHSPEMRKTISKRCKGRLPPPTAFKKGEVSWNKGMVNYWCRDEKNIKWKGEKRGYVAIHNWIKYYYGRPNECENCGLTPKKKYLIHWANKSGRYLREREDWMRLCAKCHRQHDMQSEFYGKTKYTGYRKCQILQKA